MRDPTDDPAVLNLPAVGGMAAVVVVGIAALFGYQWLVLRGVPARPAFLALCIVEFGCALGFVLAVLNLHDSID